MNPRELRVLLLTDSDVFAGTERHILELALGLAHLGGCEVVIGAPNRGILAERARLAGIPVFAVEKRRGLDLRAVFRLCSALRRGQFDVIHTHNGRTALLATFATVLARRGRLVNTQHFLTPAHARLRGIRASLSRAFHRWIATRADKTIAISQAVYGSIAERRAAPAKKVRVVLNGVSDPQQHELVPSAVVRAAFNIPEVAPLVLSTSRLEQEKGIETLIEAMCSVVAQIPSARCLVAGEGRARKSLQAMLNERGLEQVMTLIGFQADPFSLIAASDVFVLPSRYEPFGLALIEAMGMARPVVASRAGGPIEIVAEGQSGLFFTPGDSTDLASAILQVLSQPTLARSLGAEGRRIYLECFTARRMASDLLAVYQEAISFPRVSKVAPRD